MQSLSKCNKGINYLLCSVDLFSKYAWVVPLKDKRRIIIDNAFQKIISRGRKLNNIWLDQGGGFYNKLFKRFLIINNIEMYSTENEGKSVVAGKFMRTLENKTFKHITAISKNVYFDVLDDIVKKYNNTVHRTINMKPIDVKDNTYVDSIELHSKKKVNDKDLKLKVGDHVRISKHKNIFVKEYTPNWSEEVFISSKIKNKVPWAYVINDLNSEEIIGTFYEKELQKTNQKKKKSEYKN